MQDYDFDLLCQLAFQSWLDRGQPMGTPVFDKDFATAQLGAESVAQASDIRVNDTYGQYSEAEDSGDE